jgi:YidC/Oxa1 family membrane protein insertase
MEPRLVLFLILSVSIILIYPSLMERFIGPTNSPLQQVPIAETKPNPMANKATASNAAAATTVAAAVAVDRKEKVVETDLYRAVLVNAGGAIKTWELKQFNKKDAEGRTRPITLIPEGAAVLPLMLVEGSKTAIYQLDETPLRLNAAHPDGVVEMVHTAPDGRRVKKMLHFHNDDYRVDVDIQITGADREDALSLGTNFGAQDWTQQYGGSVGAISLIDNEVVRDKLEAGQTQTYSGEASWLAIQDKYFIGALIPRQAKVTGPITVQQVGENEVAMQVRLPKAGASFSLYAGPKSYDRLAALQVQLEETIDFGWFIFGSWLPVRLVAKPLFYILNFIYQFSYNYGIAIILLTVLVKTLFFPLTRKSAVSMKAMATLQPKVSAIREKWARDKEKMNRELMELYKTEKINPVGGCLPVLLQIPVFVALFNVLYVTIELRNAPFFFWIQDLSDKDPYYVLPIIMGISMLLQQLTQPNTMDPVQAKIMLFLPVVYTFFSINFPSGLILYWIVNNFLTVGQQYLINREPAPAAA